MFHISFLTRSREFGNYVGITKNLPEVTIPRERSRGQKLVYYNGRSYNINCPKNLGFRNDVNLS